jgi:drug/metabolite transporter (DMT)-like permease
MSLRVIVFPILAVLIWAGNAIVTKIATHSIHPSLIAFDRWLLALVLLTPVLLPRAWHDRRVIRRYLPQLAMLSLLGMTLYQGLAYYAAETTSATNMGIFFALVPLLTIVLGSLLLRERPSATVIVGGVLSFAGILLILGKGEPAAIVSYGIGHGDALMLAACLSYAAYGVLLRRWSLPLPVWTSLYVQVCFAVLFLLPGYLLAPASPMTPTNLLIVAYAGVPASIVAPALWMRAIERLGPGRTSIFINLVPIITALIAAAFLHEALRPYHWLGGGLTIGGIILAQAGGMLRQPRRTRR